MACPHSHIALVDIIGTFRLKYYSILLKLVPNGRGRGSQR